ncbi:acyl carrier protein [Streptomyces canus]|uniref:phosphopantetheine-binding protein n=1 Tax=Streptomyces canus TaxID=58343 RepID=UPI002781E945|nr:phosphopantetheine-binding protein [Streptomyces canus]MDQ0599372.1 acyl carrier protein [Streptomyces canus]
MSEVRDRLADTVTAVWTEVLGIDGIGPDDDFFDLGGDSLVATRLTARLEQRLGTAIDVLTVFDHPTIGELVTELEKAHGDRL